MSEITTIDKRMPPQLLLGFTGAAGAGKNTCADLLEYYGFHAVAFADVLRAEVAEAWRIDLRMLTDRATKEWDIPALAIGNCADSAFVVAMHTVGHDTATPRSPRWIMQHWGTEFRRAQNADYWTWHVAKWVRRMHGSGYWRLCITDVRFANEAQLIETMGGRMVEVLRPNASGSLADGTARHISESRAHLLANREASVVHNDGGMEHLHAELVRVIMDLASPDAQAARAPWFPAGEPL